MRTKEQLTEKVKQLVDRAGETYRAAPTKVAGTDTCPDAPVLRPGVYSDREKFSEHRVYRVPVRAGEELKKLIDMKPFQDGHLAAP